MTDKVLTIAEGDDWRGIYVDGRLQLEGHSFRYQDVANLALGCTRVECRSVNLGWLEDTGSLPEDLAKVEWGG